MITKVLIDIDDTLLDFNLCAKWAMDEAAKELKIPLPQETYEIFTKINLSLWKQMEKNEITTDDIYCARWNKVSQAISVEFDGAEFEERFLDNLSKSTIQVEGALELLNYLSSKYKVYAASNGPYEQQLQRMLLAGMAGFFSGYFVSEKIGYSKPSREFFDRCYKETKAESVDNLIMIGDSISADINGAKEFGIKTCWFNKDRKTAENPADYMVYNLREIKDIL